MKISFRSVPDGFFKKNPPYDENEIFRLVRKASSLGFKCFQVGCLSRYSKIEGKRLKRVLERYSMESNVHTGGRFDAEKFARTDEEYNRMKKLMRYGIEICGQINSSLVSFHPPIFSSKPEDETVLSIARKRFLELVGQETEFASSVGVKVALESFCYSPFIFRGLQDFKQFVSHFSREKLGILMDAGHLFQAKFNLDEAVQVFKDRLMDVHVHDATLADDFKTATHLPIGKGTINFPDFIHVLKKANYIGWLTLEVKGKDEEILRSKQYLQNLIEKH